MNIPRYALSAAVAAVLLSGVSASALAEAYKVDTLPQTPTAFGNTISTIATDINASGEVAGVSDFGESFYGSIYWDAAGQVTNLTPGDYPTSGTAGISDTGTVVYSDTNFGGSIYAWNAGAVTDLGIGYASAVNGKGQVVGTFGDVFGIWTDGVVSPLPLPSPGTYASAYDINNNGDVVGTAYFADTNSYRAVIWRNGTVQEIGTLAGDIRSVANAINDAGQVVGYSASSTNKWRAFYWDNGVISDLSLSTDAQSFALGINNAGQVVGGAAAPGSYNNHPVVWQNGARSDLSAVLSDGNCSAYDINENGAMVVNCTANYFSGPQAFRFTPVAAAGDLSVRLAISSNPGVVGLPFVYTTTVTNIGNATTANAMLAQTLPATGFTLNSITSSKGSCSGTSVVECAFGDLAGGESVVVNIAVTPTVAEFYNTSAVATTSTPEVNTVNNTAKGAFRVNANYAALSVYSKNSQTSAVRGGNITYTWNVSNGGPLPASNVILTDTLPSSLSFVSVKTTAGTCTGTATIKCNLGEARYGGAGITVTIVAKAKVRGTITNRATVTSTTPDTYLGDNTAAVTTRVR